MRFVRRLLRTAGLGGRVALASIAGYLTVLTVAAWTARPGETKPGVPGEPTRRFRVLIPAHDEERLIGATLASLAAQRYPRDRYEVHVVADNCTDGTAVVARQHDVEVHERTAPEAPGKGPALEWLMDRLTTRDTAVDGIVFVDADTIVDPDFLPEIDAAMADGATVVQGHYAVRDAGSTPAIAFRAAALAARNYLRPLGRTRIGGTAGLYGNGMVFAPSALRGHRWSDHLTEDAELQLELLDDGVKVAFAPRARVEAEMPATTEAAQTQHERWERGRVELTRRYVPGLVARAARGGPAGRIAYADAALDMAVPPFSVVIAGSAVWTTWAALRWAVSGGRRGRLDVAASAGTLGALVVFVLAALRLVHAPGAAYRSLARAPQMVMWKVRLWVRMLVRPTGVRWQRTARNAPGPGSS